MKPIKKNHQSRLKDAFMKAKAQEEIMKQIDRHKKAEKIYREPPSYGRGIGTRSNEKHSPE